MIISVNSRNSGEKPACQVGSIPMLCIMNLGEFVVMKKWPSLNPGE